MGIPKEPEACAAIPALLPVRRCDVKRALAHEDLIQEKMAEQYEAPCNHGHGYDAIAEVVRHLSNAHSIAAY